MRLCELCSLRPNIGCRGAPRIGENQRPASVRTQFSSITAAEPRVSPIAVSAAGAILPRWPSSEVASARQPAASPRACDRGSARRPSPPCRGNTPPGVVRKCAGSLVETTASAIVARQSRWWHGTRNCGSPVTPNNSAVISRIVSPILSNLFLHYAFDLWMSRTHPDLPWCRYADDGLVHCRTEQEAEALKAELQARLEQCQLQMHPAKTKIVY